MSTKLLGLWYLCDIIFVDFVDRTRRIATQSFDLILSFCKKLYYILLYNVCCNSNA